MKYTRLSIPDVILLEPLIYPDNRGEFFEAFNQSTFQEITGYNVDFVQDNQSLSRKGVLRGLHFQLPPHAQGKLIRVLNGEIFDVVVDIRRHSSTFGQWVGEFLSSVNKKQLWIPEGFAHGFLALADQTEVLYKVTDYYTPNLERCILWSDSVIGIKWPSNLIKGNFIISEKDLEGINFNNIFFHKEI